MEEADLRLSEKAWGACGRYATVSAMDRSLNTVVETIGRSPRISRSKRPRPEYDEGYDYRPPQFEESRKEWEVFSAVGLCVLKKKKIGFG